MNFAGIKSDILPHLSRFSERFMVKGMGVVGCVCLFGEEGREKEQVTIILY